MREDSCMMSGRPTHGAEASSSSAALPASDDTAARPEQERERVDAPLTNFSEAQAEQALWQEFRDHGALLSQVLNEVVRFHRGPAWCIFQVRDFSPGLAVSPLSFLPRMLFPWPVFSCFVRRRHELEGRAQERYGALDRLDTELSWYREQYNSLDAVVEALRTPNEWLVYRAEALWDQLLELDAQAAEKVSTVERVKTTLVDWDEALHKAREDLAGARTLAVVSVLDRQPTKGVPEVDECGLAEISNSSEETRGTQFRQVRAARCVIPYVPLLRSSGLIGCDYKMA
jgi:hypothetical protein